ncbi:phage virion morphogenesis protein [Neisseria dentiae]|uniref:phage virion morphogenesis protein n=1 Tax=Neisseria dentiae TaxID=194197 RepID=UPI00359F1FBD
MDALEEFTAEVANLIKNLSPPARRNLLRTISMALRKRNAERVRANIQPDGAAMEARDGDRWKMRGLREGEALKAGRKFHYFKERDLSAVYVRDDGEKLIVRKAGEKKRVAGYLRENVYFQGGRPRGKKMYPKLARAKYLRSRNDADSAVIGFMGGITAKIAAEHHYGDSAKKLPPRELIGISDDNFAYIKAEILDAVSKGL